MGSRVPPRAWLDRAGVSSTPPPQVVARCSCSWPGWYRDHLVVSAGAEDRAVHADRLDELRGDAAVGLVDVAAEAADGGELWHGLEKFNLNPSLALEALFVRLQRELQRPPLAPAARAGEAEAREAVRLRPSNQP